VSARKIGAALIGIGLFGLTALACVPESKGHLERGRILFERRDLKGARTELRQALKADPSMLEAHKLLARVDEYLGDQQDAAVEYEAAARLAPDDPKLRYKVRFYRQKLQGRQEPSGRAEPGPDRARG
jgi:tetratricopeptide (TPR) repeat protein